MTLHETLVEHMKEAMRAKDQARLLVIRGLIAEGKKELLDAGIADREFATDEEMLTVIKRNVKRRKDSIEQFTKGGRADLAATEQAELTLLEAYLPTQASAAEIETVVRAKIAELKLDSSKKGQLIGMVSKEFKGNADGSLIKKIVDTVFSTTA
jgi:uncharacterized protein YqeY